MKRNAVFLACLAALVLAACSQPPPGENTGSVPSQPAAEAVKPAATDVLSSGERGDSDFDQRGFAGTFTGTLPCADCPGMDVTLILQPDGSYAITHVYQERPDGTWSIDGHWSVEADNAIIRLDPNSKTEEDQLYAIESPDHIVMLDGDGQSIDSGMNYGLARRAAP